MNIEEFREMGSCKKLLKVTGLALFQSAEV